MILAQSSPSPTQAAGGFGLFEVLFCILVIGLGAGALVTGYVLAAGLAESAAYSLAAHSLALQRMEQTRAAKWDLAASPPIDELVSSNFPPQRLVLDLPSQGTNVVYALVDTTIAPVPNASGLKKIQVVCRWTLNMGGPFTNTLVTYRAPDQ